MAALINVNKSTRNWLPIFASGILLLCALFPDNLISSYTSLIIFCLLIFYIVWVWFDFSLKYCAVLFGVCANVLAVAICELSYTYLSELQCYTGFEGSLPLIVFSRSLFVLSLLFLDLRWGNKELCRRGEWRLGRYSKVLIGGSCAIIMLVTLALFAKVFSQPSFLYGYDRFQYTVMLTGIWGLMAAYMPYVIVVPIVGIRYGFKKTGIVTVVVYCFFLYWIGTKFSTFFTILCYFLLAFNDKFQNITVAKKKKYLLFVAVGLVLMLGFTAFAYGASGHSADGFLESRLAQQGQLWWKTYSLVDGNLHFNDSQFAVEAAALFDAKSIADSVGQANGIYGIMYLCAPSDLVTMRLSLGSRYTEAGYAMAYVLLGFLGPVIFALVTALLVYAVQNSLAVSLRRGKIVSGVCAALLVGYASVATGMFVFSQFFTVLGVVAVAVLAMNWLLDLNGLRRG